MTTVHCRLLRQAAAYSTVAAAGIVAFSGLAFSVLASATSAQARLEDASAAITAGGYWTGTWAAAPQSGGPSFSGQTIRQIVRTSISGRDARIEFSNVFGSSPLTISDVRLARAGSGASTVPGTGRAVTFRGSSAVTIPAGGSVASDAIQVAVPALTEVAISFYVPGPTGPSTYHSTALQTSYVAPGDVSGSVSLPDPIATTNNYFLTGLDVQNAKSQGAVVALGASITDGVGTTVNGNDSWTSVLADRLHAAGKTIGVLNEGISGNRLLADGSGQSALHRFDRDVLGQAGVLGHLLGRPDQ